MQYKHLFFDLDHTLWDFETNAKESLHDLYNKHALANKGITIFNDFFAKYSYHNERLWDRYTKGFIKQDELRWKRMWLTLLEYKLADEVLSKKLSTDFLELLPTKKNLFPYTVEILTYLNNKGYTMHLVTNGFESVQHKKLSNSNLNGFFKEVITSEASNSLKPNKEIFDYALNKSKASVKESIMIGDNLDADIKGGMNAGLDTIFVNHLNIKPHIKATHEITHLKELETIL
ncbi:MAG: YjjG family noncanonical pyrimidine nucleotidase [Bacteroidetes bacterium]|nr:YjjG family noncanonical pyrimidine nucleotidase [Bacteroidota bacterium]MBS1590938.1 YjjG family noncanonical pyrimidine nucleotidase [Bacteroidota bacterium]MBS1639513.1 YjjG family noncanonical pyrimidine nucleotidase [Bacteroidota bacterium]MBS1641716.1 YjjG family noncanonical pyrimidine nucleotidase [Bacteroidota bacterium]MBS1671209.1 YjjG family noncanonical pyrimidine nucleotidase [Bacteroidota bacterium]